MDKRNNRFDFDFTPLGQAIKKARQAKGMTREQLARIVDYDPRHLQAVENEGQYPSIELFIQLITMFDISVDEYIHTGKKAEKSSVRRRLDAQLNRLDAPSHPLRHHIGKLCGVGGGVSPIVTLRPCDIPVPEVIPLQRQPDMLHVHRVLHPCTLQAVFQCLYAALDGI